MDPFYPVAGIVFFAVLMAVEGIYLMLTDIRLGREKNAVNRRLRMLARGRSSQDVLVTLLRRPERAGLVAWMVENLPPVAALDDLVSRAGATISLGRLLAAMAGGFVLLALLGIQVATLPVWQALVFALAMSTLMPALVLYRLSKRRMKRFSLQLSDAVDTIARSLKAGHPVPTAIGQVAREMPDPIGTEFGLVYDEMTYGKDLREALDNLAQRVNLPDLQYMVLAVRIQYGTGGNLAEVLNGLGRLIRERVRMQHKIKALSAEGRVSAIVLTVLPLAVVGLISVLSPNYYGEVWNLPAFHKAMAMALGSVVAGIIVMYRLINFRV